ncbi:MAG TPA: hypothetical protein VIK74_09105 [Parasegetibacter sp.]
MKYIVSALLLCSAIWLSNCKPKDADPEKADNPLDAGREFIRASLDGSYNRAYFYTLKDSLNEELLQRWRESYQQIPREERENYSQASIIINKVENVNDSITIINYSNSYKKTPLDLKVIRYKPDEWLVDFKYTFSGD